MPSLAEIAKKLNKEYKNDNLIIKGDLIKATEKLPTMAFGMDYPLFGGLPLGHICVYSGLPGSGKTSAACQELAAFQRAFPKKECVYVDAEHRLELDFQARMNGLDISRLTYINIPSGMSAEQVLDLVIEMEKADNIGMIVIDSVPALLTAATLKADMTEDPGMRGTIAKKMYPFLTEMKTMLTEKQNILILINQVRDGGMMNGIQLYKEPCGMALQFMPSVSVRFGKRKFTQGDNMNACSSTNGEDADGFRLQFKITKNSTAQPTRGGGFITYRYATGIDWLNDLIEIAEGFDFIQKSGSYRTLINLETGEAYEDKDGKPLRGYMSELKEYIKNNPDFQKEYVGMLNRRISSDRKSYGTLLSKDDDAYISNQEKALSKEEKI